MGFKEGMDVGAGEVVGAGEDDIVMGTETEVVELKELWRPTQLYGTGTNKNMFGYINATISSKTLVALLRDEIAKKNMLL